MVNKVTRYKNPDRLTCIDLILTNCLGSFQNSGVVETGLSDFHKMVVIVMKTPYRKSQPKTIHYRDYKNFSNDIFRDRYRKSKQRNLCIKLLRKSLRECFNNLNEKNVYDNNRFWRVGKPLLSNKIISNEKIRIVEGDKIIRSDKETAKDLNEFFSNVVTNLNIQQLN